MSELVAKIAGFLPRKGSESNDPVFSFFFSTKARTRKRVYLNALKKAQNDQEQTLKEAKEKTRV